MNEAGRVIAREDGTHEVRTQGGEVLLFSASNAAAWRSIDRYSSDGQAGTDRHHRIRPSGPFS